VLKFLLCQILAQIDSPMHIVWLPSKSMSLILACGPNGPTTAEQSSVSIFTGDVTGPAEVVVVGGGCISTLITYYLTSSGLRDVVLLEKGVLTSRGNCATGKPGVGGEVITELWVITSERAERLSTLSFRTWLA